MKRIPIIAGRYRSFSTEAPVNARIVVFGANGYVGQQIVHAALKSGVNVTAINRSGKPSNFQSSHKNDARVAWLKGDIFNGDSWRHELKGATGVISCVGAFGSNEVQSFF